MISNWRGGRKIKEAPVALKTTTCGNFSLKLFMVALIFISGHITDVPKCLCFTEKQRGRLALALTSA